MTPGILVVAKAPVSGSVKTRIAADIGFDAAAEVAAAALLDTLDTAMEVFDKSSRVLALTGDLSRAACSQEISSRLDGWKVVRQRGTSFGARLTRAHRDAARVTGSAVVQIGMDTPQVTPAQLRQAGFCLDDGRGDGVLGPAVDGGWWVLGLSRPDLADGLASVAMSTDTTCNATRSMLERAGAAVVLVDSLRDVDTLADADVVAAAAPHTRFAAVWRDARRRTPAPVELLDEALEGTGCVAHGWPGGPVQLPIERWTGTGDDTDLALVARCAGPTIDIGCGPGRLTEALARRGTAVLGIDIAPGAVRRTRARGVDALCRDVFDPMPLEGDWGSVLLADGNIGIGGDPVRLLRRVAHLLKPRGRAVVEVAPPGTILATYRLRLEVGGRLSGSFPWAVLGPEALAALAHKESLGTLRVSTQGGRWFVELEKVLGD